MMMTTRTLHNDDDKDTSSVMMLTTRTLEDGGDYEDVLLRY